MATTDERECSMPYAWEFCRSCGGGGWVGSRVNHKHPGCGHRCTLCYPPPGYDRTYALDVPEGNHDVNES